MDGTLYTNPAYCQMQIDKPVEKLAGLRGKSFAEMEQEIADFRAEWARTHDGQKTSLGNVFAAFGVGIAESVRWREELYEPADYIAPDLRLRETLLRLSSAYKLCLVTNNPVSVARKTLAALGADGLFPVIVGLDTCFVSKPNDAPFRKAVDLADLAAGECVAVGDRFDIDIAVPLKLGMGGVLVGGVGDVYELPEKLGIK